MLSLSITTLLRYKAQDNAKKTNGAPSIAASAFFEERDGTTAGLQHLHSHVLRDPNRYGDQKGTSMSAFTIVFPNRCQVCTQNKVPMEQRTIMVLDHEEICGKCGSSVGSTHSIRSTLYTLDCKMLQTIVRSLVQHGVFEIEASPSSLNPFRLCRKDEEVQGLITCHVNYSSTSGNTPETRAPQRYERSKIGFALPVAVRSACELLGGMRLENLDGSPAFMSFDSADMKRERKSLRFSWSRRVDYDNGYRYNYEQVSIEIVWIDKDNVQLPSPEAVDLSDGRKAAESDELRIKADIILLRAAVWQELMSKSATKSVAIYSTVNFEEPQKLGVRYHPVAVEQIVKELDIVGWMAERVGPSLMGNCFLAMERKK
jgi:hypothetical protein